MRKTRARVTRNHLSAIAARLAHKGATSAEISAIFKKKHAATLAAEIDEIVDIGVTKIIADVCATRLGSLVGVQLEMFAEYSIPSLITLDVSDQKGPRRIHKAVGSTSLSELRGYVTSKLKPRPNRSPRLQELARLVDDLERVGVPDDWPIDDCWAAQRSSANSAG